jgi:putative cell wall-binding protein
MDRPGVSNARTPLLGALAVVVSSLSGAALLATPAASAAGARSNRTEVSHPGRVDALRAAIRHVDPGGPDAVSRHGAARPGGVALPRSTSSGSHVSPRANGGLTIATPNWSGVVQTGSNFSSVGGHWHVPPVRPSQAAKLTSTWVGIGGTTTASTTTPFIQAGILEVTATGLTGSFAWYEDYPSPPVYLTPRVTPHVTPATAFTPTVFPGDAVSVSITDVGGTDWRIEIDDTTRGWSYTRTVTFEPTLGSAEWITERPLVTTTTAAASALATLADYTATTFTHLTDARTGAAPTTPGVTPNAFTYTTMYDTLCTGAAFTSSKCEVVSLASTVTAATADSFTDLFTLTRTYGRTADGTAAQELEHQFPPGGGPTAPTGTVCPGTTSTRPVVLATDTNYPDALASAYLASYLGTGTLLTPTSSLSSTTLSALRLEGITRVFVVGGPLAVSTAVVDELEATPAYGCGGGAEIRGGTIQVTRIFGRTLYDTAEQIASWPTAHTLAGHPAVPGEVDLSGAYAGVNAQGGEGLYNVTGGGASTSPPGTTPVPTAVLATGRGFQDAESASTLAYAAHLPILLTTSSTLSAQAATAIQTLGIKQVLIMGGQLALSDTLVTQLAALSTHPSVLRIAGADATDTSVELALCELGSATGHLGLDWPGTGAATVARGDFYTDGLAGAVVAAGGPTAGAPEPLLLTESPRTVGPYVAGFLHTAGVDGIDDKFVFQLTVLGGQLAVTPAAVNSMEHSLGL